MTFSSMHRRRSNVVFLLLWFATPFLLWPMAAARATDSTVLRVMTQNLFSGTNFEELLTATTLPAFLAGVTTSYQKIQATNPAERAAALAREIARQQPDIVGLQEVTILRTGATRPATTVQSDQLQLLLAELAKRHQRYQAVAIVPGLDAEAPSTLGFDVRVSIRDVLIVRSEFSVGNLQLSNLQVDQYVAHAAFATPAGPIIDPSGWAALDVTARGVTFRFVTTHLDVNPAVALQQARELVQSAGNTTLPVILVCDCNSKPDDPADPTFATYQVMQAAGFADAFRQAHPNAPGFTCCQDEDLKNPAPALGLRIDLIQVRGPFRVQDVRVIGDGPGDRTPSGLWPSDHAGVVATLKLSTKKGQN